MHILCWLGIPPRPPHIAEGQGGAQGEKVVVRGAWFIVENRRNTLCELLMCAAFITDTTSGAG